MKHGLRVVVLALGALQAASGSGLAADVVLAPHRAVYDVTLKRTSERADLSGADGRLAMELGGSDCEGWTTSFRMANEFRPREGNGRVIDTQSAGWESGDGLSMRYNQREFLDGSQQAERKVSARRDAAGGIGQAEFEKPEQRTLELSPDTVFSIEHQKRLLRAAMAGSSHDSTLVFDGSDDSAGYRAIAFIGARKAPGQARSAIAGAAGEVLSKLSAWPMTISFYSTKPGEDGGEATPAYQIGLTMYENGVADNLVLDYGDFALGGNLKVLEFLKQEPCE
ncbi:MAG: cell envelope integrity EipB family protein [Rhizobiales bacterium]|nr:cell envelope integrity EipB family protein [Hyphomicrobiales bacterium]